MSNFLHKPCCPDGQNSKKIAKRIRKKATEKIQNNDLSFLLNRHLDSKLIPQVKLSQINDFAILKRKQIIRRILFGTFQMKQCKSYVQEMVENGVAYILSEKLIKENRMKVFALI